MNEREIALITGASSGIGKELARIFAAEGCDVVLVARSEDKLQSLSRELESTHGINAHVVTADLTKPSATNAIFDSLHQQAIVPTCVVNNAGFGANGAFASLSLPLQLDMIQTNISALVSLTYLALQEMLARKKGRILNVASVAGFQPGPGMAVYYATKAFVISFSEAIAEEVRSSGVTVTALCPGPTATGFAEIANNATSNLFKRGASSPETVARYGYRAMMKGKTLAVPGVMNACVAGSVRFLPRSLVRKIAGWLNET